LKLLFSPTIYSLQWQNIFLGIDLKPFLPNKHKTAKNSVQ